MSIVDDLAHLSEMRAGGVLTEAEFRAAKRQLLQASTDSQGSPTRGSEILQKPQVGAAPTGFGSLDLELGVAACPECGSRKSVDDEADSWWCDQCNSLRRRRLCSECGLAQSISTAVLSSQETWTCGDCGSENPSVRITLPAESSRPTVSAGLATGLVVVIVIAVVGGAIWFLASLLGGSSDTPVDPSISESIEYKLAVIDGDLSTEDEFGRILDQIQEGGGICNPEPDREHIADVLVAGWEESGKRESLIVFARALATACS